MFIVLKIGDEIWSENENIILHIPELNFLCKFSDLLVDWADWEFSDSEIIQERTVGRQGEKLLYRTKRD